MPKHKPAALPVAARQPSKKILDAFHEAGHVVAAIQAGYVVKSASMAHEEGSDGHVYMQFGGWPRSLEKVTRLVRVWVAGIAAEAKRHGGEIDLAAPGRSSPGPPNGGSLHRLRPRPGRR